MNALMAMDFKFILMKETYCYEPMNEHIRQNYRKIKEFPGGVMVYERK